MNAEDDEHAYEAHPSIRFFSQDAQKGKTFEYELALCNPTLELLVTDSMSNKNEIKDMMGMTYEQAKERIKHSDKWDVVKSALELTDWDDEEKKRHLVAARYLSSVGKGENALELCLALEDNYELEDGDDKFQFVVPPYIHSAFEWLLR